MSSLGKRLIKSTKEGRAIARGEADVSIYKVLVPATIDVKQFEHDAALLRKNLASNTP